MNLHEIKDFFLQLQQTIIQQLQSFEPDIQFLQDAWQREAGGGGLTCVLENGAVFEKAGVNFSHIHGGELPAAATIHRPELKGCHFQAMGVSLVIHPRNPYVPTTHLNVRFFIAEQPNAEPIWWFGGGFDLTPYYGFIEDCVHWHLMAKKSCDAIDPKYYPIFKKACDDYFYLKHRSEARGIGGLFFDDFNEKNLDYSFSLVKSIGLHFLEAYLPIVNKRYQMPYGEAERDFQSYRRTRYVEFNLLFDRGTLFGLQSQGRVESILMSLPPIASWRYNWQPAADTVEANFIQDYLLPRDWLQEKITEPLRLIQ